jgi:hypothetical protein
MEKQRCTVQHLENCLDRLEGINSGYSNSEQHALRSSLIGASNSKKKIIRILYDPPDKAHGGSYTVIRVSDSLFGRNQTEQFKTQHQMIDAVRNLVYNVG